MEVIYNILFLKKKNQPKTKQKKIQTKTKKHPNQIIKPTKVYILVIKVTLN